MGRPWWGVMAGGMREARGAALWDSMAGGLWGAAFVLVPGAGSVWMPGAASVWMRGAVCPWRLGVRHPVRYEAGLVRSEWLRWKERAWIELSFVGWEHSALLQAC